MFFMKRGMWVFIFLLFIPILTGADPVDINKATAEELDENLHGVGPKKAKAIIDYREENGPYQSAEELDNVKGVGAKTIEKNLDNIVISE